MFCLRSPTIAGIKNHVLRQSSLLRSAAGVWGGTTARNRPHRQLSSTTLIQNGVSVTSWATRGLRDYFGREGNGGRRAVGHWLIATSGAIFGIVILGGLTRLTESGLSMVDWKLIHFAPPRSQSEWEEYFIKYQQFPEYQLQNKNMTLEEFKKIYWMEHAHRVYGRLLGLGIILPSLFFIKRRWTSEGIRNVLIGCCGLVGFQGLLGWYMVKSGLKKELMETGEPARVSPYRLTAHLGLAFTLYLVTLATGIRILSSKQLPLIGRVDLSRLKRVIYFTHQLSGLTFLTAMTGALVAGLDAGMIYNSFPKMGDRWIPSDILEERLGWRNLTENPTTVQFIHRCMAITTVSGVTGLWAISRGMGLPPAAKRALNLVMATAWMQGSLGLLTLLYVVPIPLASAHQAGSLALLSSFVWLMSVLKRIPR